MSCQDGGRPSLRSTSKLLVEVSDVNDHPPQFVLPVYSAELHENNYVGYVIVQVGAYDLDLGDNAEVSYAMTPGKAATHFSIDRRTGTVTAKVSLDREDQPGHRFEVLAFDGGTPQRTGTATIEVRVLDVNDERPIFAEASFSFNFGENQEPGKGVGRIAASDADSPPYDRFSFTLLDAGSPSDSFSVDPLSGEVVTTRALDREEQDIYHLLAVARDDHSPALSSSAPVIVTVDDVNDCAPTFRRSGDDVNASVVHVSNLAVRGHVVTSVRADDDDVGENGRVTYAVDGEGEGRLFSVDHTRGLIILTRNLQGDEDNGVSDKNFILD